jgi:hypothetical protein
VHLTCRVHEAHEHTRADGDHVFFIVNVRELDIRINIIGKVLVSNLLGINVILAKQQKVELSYTREPITNSFEGRSLREPEGEIYGIQQSDGGTCAESDKCKLWQYNMRSASYQESGQPW